MDSVYLDLVSIAVFKDGCAYTQTHARATREVFERVGKRLSKEEKILHIHRGECTQILNIAIHKIILL